MRSTDPRTYVFFDRDGTLIEHIPYLAQPSQVRVLPTVIEALTLLRDAGCRLFLHTNQSGVGRGMFSHEAVVACNVEMMRQLGLGDAVFERICIAPESPDDEAVYRKPSPRFGREIAALHGVPTDALVYVGDNISDLRTAVNLGCAAIGVDSGGHDLRAATQSDPALREFPVVSTLIEAARRILGRGTDSRKHS